MTQRQPLIAINFVLHVARLQRRPSIKAGAPYPILHMSNADKALASPDHGVQLEGCTGFCLRNSLVSMLHPGYDKNWNEMM